jgi:hypothetical protein
MTRQFTRCLLAIMVVPIILAVAASPTQAETNKHYEACQTLGGEYEERRTNCDPECKTTYICRFKEGWSRVCDDQGVCNQVQDGSSGNTPNSAESSQQEDGDSDDDWNAESGDSFEDCVDKASDHCRNQCDDEVGFDAVDCARSCLEDLEGQCEEYDYGSDDSSSDQSNEECEECQVLCEDACGRLRQSWRRDTCLSECKSRCDNVCD